MKKIYIIITLILTSCFIDDINEQNIDVYEIPETMCECIFWDLSTQRWHKIQLRPGQISVGWESYSRLSYCQEVMEGYLIDC